MLNLHRQMYNYLIKSTLKSKVTLKGKFLCINKQISKKMHFSLIRE